MITLKKDNIVMEVATELQASPFLRSGYKVVEKPAEPVAEEPVKVEEAPTKIAEAPKRRRRKKVEAETAE